VGQVIEQLAGAALGIMVLLVYVEIVVKGAKLYVSKPKEGTNHDY
jgi:hypothetical protein